MTQEEKARRYNEALANARQEYDTTENVERKQWLEELFPELKESEDERIKKSIIKFLIDVNNGAYTKSELEIASWIDWLEKQDEKKPVDKVEPKFKNGQWIVFNGLTLYVNEVVQGYYRTTSIGGIPNSYDWNIDNAARLWTIQDAKDGDIIYANSKFDTSSYIRIFYKLENKVCWGYCNVYSEDLKSWEFNGSKGFIRLNRYNFYPATKEQRDLLFQKMKEAGYEWDANKKELKKFHVIDEGKAEMDYCFTKMMNGEKVGSAWTEEDECYMEECLSAIATKDGWSFEEKRKTKHWLKSIKQRMEEQQ